MKTVTKYTWIGIGFGFMFPLGALILVVLLEQIPFNSSLISLAHHVNPLLYMIDSAPLFLGIFAYIGGLSKAKSEVAQIELQIALDKVSIEQNRIGHMNEQLKEGIFSVQNVQTDLMNNQLHLNESLEQLTSSESRIKMSMDHSKLALQQMVEIQTHLENSLKDSDNHMQPFYALIEHTASALHNNFTEMATLERSFQTNAVEIAQLTGSTEDVQKTFAIISSLQSGTALLALNASIEAARAGDFGRGFDVVAKEMKKLSDETSHSLKDSEETLSNFHHRIELISENNTHLQNTLENSSTKMERLKNQVSAFTTEINNIKTDQIQLKEQMATLLSKIDDLVFPLEENMRGINQLEADLKIASAPIQKTKTLIEQLQEVMGVFRSLQ